ncbi:putative lipoate-protein ligase A [Rubripirellula lacrimiformis]|uniref:Putative lipoate-protein ligase A n=1 Tax=Rubripirellula lacrimiformis TaxID=1930273 RepID=A0A517N3R8_9BACT|nr:lipoate--protein ligase family protein [Rubripirellula lacrimiformis]QDT01782.1 putative lipoate-protein ligase A [Rubripirellula lacrimiformis]
MRRVKEFHSPVHPASVNSASIDRAAIDPMGDASRVGGLDASAPASLAIDEAMLLWADEVTAPDHVSADHASADHASDSTASDLADTELIRIWQFDRPTVVLGRSSKVNDEVDQEFCDRQGIPILRRCSGGAAIVAGPGCLMYSVVLSFHENPELQKIDAAHDHVMAQVLRATQKQLPDATLQGICDLTWNNRKCSGNSLRIARRHLLYHGTVLHDFDLQLLSRCLVHAPRQPDYRQGRDHGSFVTNVPVDPDRFATDLVHQFEVDDSVDVTLWSDRVERLRQQRYDLSAWHLRH